MYTGEIPPVYREKQMASLYREKGDGGLIQEIRGRTLIQRDKR